jgi:hypothetical protein
MEDDFSEEKAGVYAKEGRTLAIPSNISQGKNQAEPLQKLLEELMVASQPPTAAPSMQPGDSPSGPLNKERKRRFKTSFFPLLLSIAFLVAFFLGTFFGFYWGNVHQAEEKSAPLEEIDIKISKLSHQMEEIYQLLSPRIPPHELIEPLPPLTHQERLSPQAKA